MSNAENMYRVAKRWLRPCRAYDDDDTALHMLDQRVHAEELGTALDSAEGLDDELFPQSSDVLIEDHEKARGIQPDSSKTLAQRRADVQWKWQGPGGAKPADLQAALKRKMGYAPRIVEMLQADLDDGWRSDDEYRMYRFYVLADPTKKTAAYPYTDQELQDIVDFYAQSHTKGLVVHRLYAMCDDDETHVERDLVYGDENGFNLFDAMTVTKANKVGAWTLSNLTVVADNSPDGEVLVPPYADKLTQTLAGGYAQAGTFLTTTVGATYTGKVKVYSEGGGITCRVQLNSVGGSGAHNEDVVLVGGEVTEVTVSFVETNAGLLRMLIYPATSGTKTVWCWDHELYET